MYELKIFSLDAIPRALEKAERYRLLGDPYGAESICLDILAVAPAHQQALKTLLLAYTDKFPKELNPAYNKALEVLEKLSDDYCKHYYSGIIYERRAKAHLHRSEPGSGQVAYEWFSKAMQAYGEALQSCMPGSPDAVLRWNACARILNENPNIAPAPGKTEVEMLDSWDG